MLQPLPPPMPLPRLQLPMPLQLQPLMPLLSMPPPTLLWLMRNKLWLMHKPRWLPILPVLPLRPLSMPPPKPSLMLRLPQPKLP